MPLQAETHIKGAGNGANLDNIEGISVMKLATTLLKPKC